jgi:hypothetical protein
MAAMRPFGPTAHPESRAANARALNAPLSKVRQVWPPSEERSEPEVPVAIHRRASGRYSTAERKPAGSGGSAPGECAQGKTQVAAGVEKTEGTDVNHVVNGVRNLGSIGYTADGYGFQESSNG